MAISDAASCQHHAPVCSPETLRSCAPYILFEVYGTPEEAFDNRTVAFEVYLALSANLEEWQVRMEDCTISIMFVGHYKTVYQGNTSVLVLFAGLVALQHTTDSAKI